MRKLLFEIEKGKLPTVIVLTTAMLYLVFAVGIAYNAITYLL